MNPREQAAKPVSASSHEEERVRAFVGANDRYYAYAWRFARGFGRMNLSACLFGPLWFALRRNWTWAVLLALAYLVFDLVLTANPFHITLPVELMLLSGVLANGLYRRQFKTVEDDLQRRRVPDPAQVADLRRLGGRDWRGAGLLLVGMLACLLLLPSFFGIQLFHTRVVRLDPGSLVWTLARPEETRARELWLLRQDYLKAFLEGRFDRSLAVAENALRLSYWKLGEEDPITIGIQNDLISNHLRAGRYARALELTEEGLRTYQVRFGKDHPFVAFMLNNRVSNYLYQGLYDRARSDSFNSLLILETYRTKEEHPFLQSNLAAIYSNLAFIQQAYGEQAEAERNHREALTLALQAAAGPNLQVTSYLERLGDWYTEQMQLDEAEVQYRQVQNLAERTLGVENPLMSSILLNLGRVLSLRRQYAQAEPLLRRAHEINGLFYGQAHTATAESACQLGRVCFAQGKLFEAETFLGECLAVTRAAIGEDNVIYAGYAVQMAGLKMFRNDTTAAKKLLTASVEVFARIYGDDHPRVLIPLEPLAEVYERLGRPLARQEVLDRIWRIRAGAPEKALKDELHRLDPNRMLI